MSARPLSWAALRTWGSGHCKRLAAFGRRDTVDRFDDVAVLQGIGLGALDHASLVEGDDERLAFEHVGFTEPELRRLMTDIVPLVVLKGGDSRWRAK